MKSKRWIYILFIIWIPFSGFDNQNNKVSYSCYSDYRVTNNTSSAIISHITILATDDIVGAQSYDENVYIWSGNYFDIPPSDFATLRTTLYLKIIVTTITPIIGKEDLYINGVLIKSASSSLPSDKHGITYNVPFYCGHVEFVLSEQ